MLEVCIIGVDLAKRVFRFIARCQMAVCAISHYCGREALGRLFCTCDLLVRRRTQLINAVLGRHIWGGGL